MDDYVYSDNEEVFIDEIEDLVDEMAVGETKTMWRGTRSIRRCSDFLDVGDLLDLMSTRADDECGEFADGYLISVDDECSVELERQIKELLDRWADKHNIQPHWFTVKGSEPFLVTRLDESGSFRTEKI